MTSQNEPRAVAIARAHAEAWSKHDFETARKALADDVKVKASTTQPIMAPTELAGADNYMVGLTQFAHGVVPGSLRVIASVGDESNALLMLTVEADLGGGKVTLPGARLYLIDEDGKIKSEQVIFYAGTA
jgi:hypothetical protein